MESSHFLAQLACTPAQFSAGVVSLALQRGSVPLVFHLCAPLHSARCCTKLSLVMSPQERPPFIPEGVVARRKRMDIGEPRRKRVGLLQGCRRPCEPGVGRGRNAEGVWAVLSGSTSTAMT